MSRRTGTVVTAAGALLAILPVFDWFTVGTVGVRGVSTSGAVAVLPLVGALIAWTGMRMLLSDDPAPERTAGPWLLALGMIALAIAALVTWSAPVHLESRLDDTVVRLPAEPRPTVVAWGAVAAAGLVAAAGTWSCRRALLRVWRNRDG